MLIPTYSFCDCSLSGTCNAVIVVCCCMSYLIVVYCYRTNLLNCFRFCHTTATHSLLYGLVFSLLISYGNDLVFIIWSKESKHASYPYLHIGKPLSLIRIVNVQQNIYEVQPTILDRRCMISYQ